VTRAGCWFAACRYKVKLGHGDYIDQQYLVPARMIKRATEKEVELGRMWGEIV
jgi:hypothetical protein